MKVITLYGLQWECHSPSLFILVVEPLVAIEYRENGWYLLLGLECRPFVNRNAAMFTVAKYLSGEMEGMA